MVVVTVKEVEEEPVQYAGALQVTGIKKSMEVDVDVEVDVA